MRIPQIAVGRLVRLFSDSGRRRHSNSEETRFPPQWGLFKTQDSGLTEMTQNPNPLDRLDLRTMALALIAASEQCSRLVPGSNSLHWRIGFSTEAIARKRVMSDEELLELLDISYPELTFIDDKGES